MSISQILVFTRSKALESVLSAAESMTNKWWSRLILGADPITGLEEVERILRRSKGPTANSSGTAM
jgi:hypothetical protein